MGKTGGFIVRIITAVMKDHSFFRVVMIFFHEILV